MSKNFEASEKILALVQKGDQVFCEKEALVDKLYPLGLMDVVLVAMAGYSFANGQVETAAIMAVILLGGLGITLVNAIKVTRLMKKLADITGQLADAGEAVNIDYRHLTLQRSSQSLSPRAVARSFGMPAAPEIAATNAKLVDREQVEITLDRIESRYRTLAVRSKGLKVYEALMCTGAFWAAISYMTDDISAMVMGLVLLVFAYNEASKVYKIKDEFEEELSELAHPLTKLGLSHTYDPTAYLVRPICQPAGAQRTDA